MDQSGPSVGDILIVDDQPETLQVLDIVLTQQGYRVRSASDGRSALKMAHESPPDLILLDVRLPDMDGSEVCERLKADERTRDVPVVFISVMDQTQDKVRAFAAGGVDYVTKPLQMEELLARLETHLALRVTRKQLKERNVLLEQEIAERERAEAALREGEERYRSLFEGARDQMFVVDRGLRYVMVNNSALQAGGFTLEDVVGKTPRELFRTDAEFYCSQYRRAFETGEPLQFERGLMIPTGLHFFSVTLSPIKDAQGRVIALTGISRDVTAHRRAEEALRRRTEELEALREVGLELAAQLDVDALLQSIVSRAIELLEGSSGGFYRYRPERDVLEWAVSIGPNLAPVGSVLHRGEGLSGKVWETGEPLIVDAYQQWEGRAAAYEKYPWTAVLGVPVRWGEQFLGVLDVLADAPRTFSPADAELLALFAGQAAIAVRNAQLFDAAQQELAERTRVEEALRVSEGRYRAIFETTGTATVIIEEDTTISLANAQFERLSGYAREELEGKKSWTEFVVPKDLERMIGYHDLRRTEPDDVPKTYEFRFADRQGNVKNILLNVDVIPGTKQSVGSLLDTTERKQAEEERARLMAQLQEQARRVQQIMDTVPEGVLLLDADGRAVLANPVAVGDLLALARARVGDTLTRLGDRTLAELLERPPSGFWHQVAIEGPTPRYFEVIAKPIQADAAAEGWVLVIRDVTREREAERHAQQQQRLAAVGQLAGGIAHDFNNLLTAIMLYAQIPLGEPDLPPNVKRAFETILTESRRAAELVQQILDFGRCSAIETRPLDLKPFIGEAVRILERTIPESIALRLDAGPGEYVVDADPTRVQQVVMNLALNARDAMPGGGELRIGLSRVTVEPADGPPVAEMEPGEWVCLTVSDTGSGIPPEVLPYIYEPFFTTKPQGRGTGLGLAQVYGIVKQHGGHIGVETEMERGTAFHVHLPAYEERGAEERPPEAAFSPVGQGETILLVEDEDRIREVGQSVLESLGYRVLAAADGREALDVCRAAEGVDLVITDLVMPEMGGRQLLQELRTTSPDLRALAITGYAMREDLRTLKAQGFFDVVRKPFDVDALAQVVRRALDTGRRLDGRADC